MGNCFKRTVTLFLAMVKQILTTVLFIILYYWGACQTWEQTYGEENRTEFSNDIIETYDGGFIIIGDIGVSERDG